MSRASAQLAMNSSFFSAGPASPSTRAICARRGDSMRASPSWPTTPPKAPSACAPRDASSRPTAPSDPSPSVITHCSPADTAHAHAGAPAASPPKNSPAVTSGSTTDTAVSRPVVAGPRPRLHSRKPPSDGLLATARAWTKRASRSSGLPASSRTACCRSATSPGAAGASSHAVSSVSDGSVSIASSRAITERSPSRSRSAPYGCSLCFARSPRGGRVARSSRARSNPRSLNVMAARRRSSSWATRACQTTSPPNTDSSPTPTPSAPGVLPNRWAPTAAAPTTNVPTRASDSRDERSVSAASTSR